MLYGKRVEICQDARTASSLEDPDGLLGWEHFRNMLRVDADKSVNEVVTELFEKTI